MHVSIRKIKTETLALSQNSIIPVYRYTVHSPRLFASPHIYLAEDQDGGDWKTLLRFEISPWISRGNQATNENSQFPCSSVNKRILSTRYLCTYIEYIYVTERTIGNITVITKRATVIFISATNEKTQLTKFPQNEQHKWTTEVVDWGWLGIQRQNVGRQRRLEHSSTDSFDSPPNNEITRAGAGAPWKKKRHPRVARASRRRGGATPATC